MTLLVPPLPLPAEHKAPAQLRMLDLQPGQAATIVAVRVAGSLGRRLVELGLTVGAPVQMQRRLPLGGPLQLVVRDYALSMRRSEAAHIWVELAALGGQP
jgi:Fe2+ transport system protein FeoA